MDDNMTLKIDPESKDFTFDEEGIMETVSGNDGIAQNIQVCLTAWKGDFEDLPEHGTDYRKILSTDISMEEKEEAIRESIYQEKEVEQIEEQTVITENGISKISFRARLNNGSSLVTEVEI